MISVTSDYANQIRYRWYVKLVTFLYKQTTKNIKGVVSAETLFSVFLSDCVKRSSSLSCLSHVVTNSRQQMIKNSVVSFQTPQMCHFVTIGKIVGSSYILSDIWLQAIQPSCISRGVITNNMYRTCTCISFCTLLCCTFLHLPCALLHLQ